VYTAAARRFRDLLAARCSAAPGTGVPDLDRIVAALVLFLREEQAILGATEEIQAAINTLLERTPARRPLTARDLRVNFAMYGGSIAEFPYLFDMLEDELGIRVECTAGTIEITDVTSVPDLGASRTESDPSRHASTLASTP
jgi:hypothetical protein